MNAAVESIWRVVAAIPAGRVATYGEVARLAGLPRGARQVGRALGLAPAARKLPWFRVIGAGGRIALPKDSAGYRTQIRKLKAGSVALPKPTTQRLSRLVQQLVELERWESFGQHNARIQLCERAETLATQTLDARPPCARGQAPAR